MPTVGLLGSSAAYAPRLGPGGPQFGPFERLTPQPGSVPLPFGPPLVPQRPLQFQPASLQPPPALPLAPPPAAPPPAAPPPAAVPPPVTTAPPAGAGTGIGGNTVQSGATVQGSGPGGVAPPAGFPTFNWNQMLPGAQQIAIQGYPMPANMFGLNPANYPGGMLTYQQALAILNPPTGA